MPPAESDKSWTGVSYWKADVAEAEAEPLSRTLDEIVSRNGKVNNLVLLQRYKGEGDKWQGELQTSVTATQRIIEALASQFTDSSDNSIVLVSSIADQFISDTQPAGYHVAKAGLWQLACYYAVKLGPKGGSRELCIPCTLVKDENREFYSKNQQLQGLFNKVIPLRPHGHGVG